jgi:hypothetical protein
LIQKTLLRCALSPRLWFALWLAFSVGLAAAFPAKAQTMSYADAIGQLASACRNDIAKFCRGVPLGPRLKTCFDTNEARMSPQCQQTRGAVYVSISKRAAAQRDIGDICSADINRLCGTTRAGDSLLACLLSSSPAAISPQCNQAFTDTGWRTERARQ